MRRRVKEKVLNLFSKDMFLNAALASYCYLEGQKTGSWHAWLVIERSVFNLLRSFLKVLSRF